MKSVQFTRFIFGFIHLRYNPCLEAYIDYNVLRMNLFCIEICKNPIEPRFLYATIPKKLPIFTHSFLSSHKII